MNDSRLIFKIKEFLFNNSAQLILSTVITPPAIVTLYIIYLSIVDEAYSFKNIFFGVLFGLIIFTWVTLFIIKILYSRSVIQKIEKHWKEILVILSILLTILIFHTHNINLPLKKPNYKHEISITPTDASFGSICIVELSNQGKVSDQNDSVFDFEISGEWEQNTNNCQFYLDDNKTGSIRFFNIGSFDDELSLIYRASRGAGKMLISIDSKREIIINTDSEISSANSRIIKLAENYQFILWRSIIFSGCLMIGLFFFFIVFGILEKTGMLARKNVFSDLIIKNVKLNPFFLIFMVITLLFIHSLCLRSDSFGTSITWLTASTIKFVRNWLKENPFNIYFLHLHNPASIEFTTLSERDPYLSYPVGTTVPIYLISLLNSKVVSLRLVNAVNLINQYIIALTLSLTIFLLLLKTRIQKVYSFLMAVSSGFYYIFLPGNLNFHLNYYWADMAVMLPFVLYVCIEMIGKYIETSPNIAKLLKYGQFLLAFYGALCDYLFYLVGITIFLKRILLKEFGESKKTIINNVIVFSIPFIVALSTLLIQILYANGINKIIKIFLFRTGISEAGAKYTQSFFQSFWVEKFSSYYGLFGSIIFFSSIGILIFILLFSILKKHKLNKNITNIQMLIEFSSMVLLPCLLQVYLLKNHSAIHNFSILKFSLYQSIVPFVLIPTISCLVMYDGKLSQRYFSNIFSLTLILSSIYTLTVVPSFKDLFPSHTAGYSRELFIRDNTSYDDIVFSSNYEIPASPPEKISFSDKRVYKVNTINKIVEMVDDLKGDYTINVFIDSRWTLEENENYQNILPLIDFADNIVNEGDYSLYKISKERFLEYIYLNNEK